MDSSRSVSLGNRRHNDKRRHSADRRAWQAELGDEHPWCSCSRRLSNHWSVENVRKDPHASLEDNIYKRPLNAVPEKKKQNDVPVVLIEGQDVAFVFDTGDVDAIGVVRSEKFIGEKVSLGSGWEFSVFGMIKPNQRHSNFTGDRLFPEVFHFGQIRCGCSATTGVRTKNDAVVALDDVAFGQMSNGRVAFAVHRGLIRLDRHESPVEFAEQGPRIGDFRFLHRKGKRTRGMRSFSLRRRLSTSTNEWWGVRSSAPGGHGANRSFLRRRSSSRRSLFVGVVAASVLHC